MTLGEFQAAIINYATQDVIPSLKPTSINLFGFAVPVSAEMMQFAFGMGTGMSAVNLEQYAPALQGLGIMSKDGVVDQSKLCEVAKEQIGRLPNQELKVGPMIFSAEDIDALAKWFPEQ